MTNASNINASYDINVLFTRIEGLVQAQLDRVSSSIKKIATKVFDSTIKPVHNRLTFAATWISETRVYKFHKKWDPIDVVVAAGQVVVNAYAAVEGLIDKISNVAEKARGWFETNAIAKNTLAAFQFVPLLFAPSAIKKIGKSVTKIFSKAVGIKKFDAMLAIAAKMAILAEGLKSAAEGLQQLGLVAKDAISWTSGVAIAAIVLSVANIAISARSLYKKYVFKMQADAIVTAPNRKDPKVLNYADGIDSMLSDPKAAKWLGATTEQFDKIKEYSEKHKDNPSASRKIYHNLRKRVSSKMFSDKLTIVAATISLVASIIMLAVPGLQPLALAVAAVSMAVIVGKLVVDRMDNVKWNAWIERIPEPQPPVENEPVMVDRQAVVPSDELAPPRRRGHRPKALQTA